MREEFASILTSFIQITFKIINCALIVAVSCLDPFSNPDRNDLFRFLFILVRNENFILFTSREFYLAIMGQLFIANLFPL